MYGGSTTSILMRIPGEAASVMTCIDGYEMTRKGRAGPALAIAAIGSYIAGTVSVVALMLLAPPLASFALRFGPPEYFALLMLGLLVLAYMSGGSMLKSLAMAALGLLLGMIGIDPMTGFFRFSYGLVELGDGIGVVPVAVGLFGLSEILLTAGQPTATEIKKPRLKDLLPSRRGMARFDLADRARNGARLFDRHHSRLGSHHLVVRFLRGGEAPLEASGALRPRRHRRRRRPGVGEQLGHLRRFCSDARAGRSFRTDTRRDDRRDDGAWHLAGAAA